MKLNQTPGTLDIEIRRGDTFNKLVTISDTDLTGYELSAGIIYEGQSLLDMTITESDLSAGKFYISIEDTSHIPRLGATWFLTWSIGDVIRTILSGKFEAIA